MKCKYCGSEIPEDSIFCGNCGKSVQQQEEVETNTLTTGNNDSVNEKLLDFFRDKLFLTICILISAYTAISCLNGSFPVLSVLFTIFLWIIYSQARKGIVDDEKMRCVSGTIFAGYIITWVVIGLLALSTVFLGISISVIGNSEELFRMIQRILYESDIFILEELQSSLNIATLSVLSIVLALVVVILVLIIIVVLVNIFGLRILHKFAKSLYLSAQNGDFILEKYTSARKWMMTLGVIYAVTAIINASDYKAFLATGSLSAVYIVSYVLLGKHLKNI